MKKTIIIREIGDGDPTLVVDILQDGYNIIERTVYGIDEKAKEFLKALEIEE